MRKFWLVGGLVLALAASAQASTVISPDSGSAFAYQSWVDGAFVPTPDTTLRVVENTEGCSGYVLGCTDGATVWLNLFAPPRDVRSTLLHEVGHVYSLTLTAYTRERFGTFTRRVSATGGYDDELFARIYAICATHDHFRPRYNAGPLRYAAMRAACRVIRYGA